MRIWLVLGVACLGCGTGGAGDDPGDSSTTVAGSSGPSDSVTGADTTTSVTSDTDADDSTTHGTTSEEDSSGSTGEPTPTTDWCAEPTMLIVPYIEADLLLPSAGGYDLYHRDIEMVRPGVVAHSITRHSWIDGTLTELAALDIADAPTALFADYDGDGLIDFFGHDSGPDVATVYLGQPAAPGFGPGQSYPAPGTNLYLAIADFDGDGDDDIFTYHNAGPDEWVGVVDGATGIAPLVMGWGPSDVGATRAAVDPTDATRVAVGFGEQLGIGFLGQVVVYRVGVASIEIESSGPEGDWPAVIDVRDNDGDGHGDVLALNQDPFGLRYYASDGAGQLVHTQTFDDASDYYIAARDFDGDGDSDLLYWQLETDLAQFRENLGGQFATPVELPGLAPGIVASRASDFDGDGREDLVLAYFSAPPGGDAGYLLLHVGPC